MKKLRKTLLMIGGLFFSSLLLSGCTANFCEPIDQSHIMYALDYGVTRYYDVNAQNYDEKGNKIDIPADAISVSWNPNVKVSTEISDKYQIYIANTNKTCIEAGIKLPSEYFWAALDYKVAELVATQSGVPLSTWTANDFKLKVCTNPEDPTHNMVPNFDGLLYKYGYNKFYGGGENPGLWSNWSDMCDFIYKATDNADKYAIIGDFKVCQADCPTSDYLKIYMNQMTQGLNQYRSCLATTTGNYGAYGPQELPVEIRGKAWTDWKGLLEFLLIWPIGALIDVLTQGFLGAGVMTGWAQILSIFVVTIIIRTLIAAATFKSTSGNAKMTALQPEITKIQNKYPNAKTNKYDQQRMSQEMSALYKKNKINPLSSLLVLIIQFPVFICVWGAMQGSAYLSTGTFLGLNLSQSISSAIFNAEAWGNGSAVTALVLFILMSVAQIFSMLIPQWMQKKRAKQTAKLGVNPSANQQNKTMKIFTTVMLVMVIIMGFSLASGLGVYWFVGALFGIAQTFIQQAITDRNQKKKKNSKVVN